MLDTILDSPLSQWLCQDTEATDHIVISSRIRLAEILMTYYLRIVKIQFP